VNNVRFNYLFGTLLYLQLQKWDSRSKVLTRFLDRLNTRWLRLSQKVAQGALGYAKQGKAERVFCGHTHVAMQAEQDGVAYYNSGSWIDTKCTYISVAEEGVTIHEYDGTRVEHRDPGEERVPALAAPFGVDRQTGLPGIAAYESVRC